jgi:hypothetical protein
MSADLYAANHSARFWKLLAADPGPPQWDAAIGRAAAALPHPAQAGADDVGRLLEAAVGERQFGRRRVPPISPQPRPLRIESDPARVPRRPPPPPRGGTRPARRSRSAGRSGTATGASSGRSPPGSWAKQSLTEAPFIWPSEATYALVLTRDVETAEDQRFAPRLPCSSTVSASDPASTSRRSATA